MGTKQLLRLVLLLKQFIKEVIASQALKESWDEIYENELYDDPALDKESLWVQKKSKQQIKQWMRDMGLATKRKRLR